MSAHRQELQAAIRELTNQLRRDPWNREAKARMADLEARLQELEHDERRAVACDAAALDWLRGLRDAAQLLAELRPDPASGQPKRPGRPLPGRRRLSNAIAQRILRAVRDRRRRISTLSQLREVEGVDAGVLADLRNTGCERLGRPEPDPKPDPKPEPDPKPASTLGVGRIGVWLPVRLETRFDTSPDRIRLRVIPDEPWFARHDPDPSDAELEALRTYLRAGMRGAPRQQLAWASFTHRHGGGRAVWLTRTFGELFDEHGDIPDGRRPTTQSDEPRFPQLSGFPSHLQVWIARAGGAPEVAGTMTVDVERLVTDLPLPLAQGDGSELEARPRWWESWDEAVAGGLATTLYLDGPLDDIDVLYVIGLDGGEPAELFGDHRDAGRLGLIGAGTPTATVDGVPAAGRVPDADAWAEVRDTAPTDAQRRVSQALTGDADALGRLPGGDGADARPLVAALWPALWGHALRDVWGLGAGVDEAGAWAAELLAPEGPFPTLRIGAQPYGLLPVTALSAWKPAPGDPQVERAIVPAVHRLREVWAAAADDAGNVEGADARRLLQLLGRSPVSPEYVHWRALPLEVRLLARLGRGAGADYRQLLEQWDANNPLAAELGLRPHRRYGAAGRRSRLRLPLVLADGVPPDHLAKALGWLVGLARSGPKALGHTDALLSGLASQPFGRTADSLLIRLAVRSLQLALADVARDHTGDRSPGLDPVGVSVGSADAIARLTGSLPPQALGADTDAVRAFERVVDGITDLALVEIDVLERLLRATLDGASHRIDPWIVGVATRRLRTTLDAPARLGGGSRALRLGAYGWVERPGPRLDRPDETDLLLAPSDAQASTAAILRDRALHDPEPDRWQLHVDSASARTAARLADAVRGGIHLAEALGAEVERAVGDRADIDVLRAAFPLRTEHGGRRLCDGEAVLDAAEPSLGISVPTGAFTALRTAMAAYGDLLVAEGVSNLVDGHPEAAAAAMDAAAGLARPPDLEVLRTRREGQTVRSSCVVVLPDEPAPELSGDARRDSELSPGTVADAAVARWLTTQLGAALDWRWTLDVTKRANDGDTAEVAVTDVRLDELGLSPVDALALPLHDLERLVSTEALDRLGAGAPPAGEASTVELVGRDGSGRYSRGVALLGALGVAPGDPSDVTDEQDRATDATATELRARLMVVRKVADALRARLEHVAEVDDEDGARDALRAATRWGIAPARAERDDRLAPLAGRAGRRLADRLAEAPAADLGADDLADALVQLASGTGHLAVLARLRRDELPMLFADTGEVGDEWQPTLAAVREPMARLDAVQLVESVRADPPLRPWTNHPGDVWQTRAVEREASDPHRLVVAYAPTTVALGTEADDGRPVEDTGPVTRIIRDHDTIAIGLVDRWSETIPGTHHAAAAAFEFDAPASRAPQAILLAVPPVVGQPLSMAAAVTILAETRDLIRARMAGSAELRHVAGLLPTSLLPARGPAAVSLTPTRGDET